MMVWLTFYYGAGTIHLFGKYKSNHLVGEGHRRKTNLLVASVIYGRRESVWASYAEDKASGSLLLLLYPRRELYASERLTMFVKQYESIGWLNKLQYLFTLTFLLLLLRESLSILQLRYNRNGKGHVMTYSADIIVDASLKMFVVGLANKNEFSLHNCCKSNEKLCDMQINLLIFEKRWRKSCTIGNYYVTLWRTSNIGCISRAYLNII